MIDDFDVDFNIDEDDVEEDNYDEDAFLAEEMEYQAYLEKQKAKASLLEDGLNNNLKRFEKSDFDQCFKHRENNAEYHEADNIEELINCISGARENDPIANVLFFVTDKTAQAALAQVSAIEEKLKPYCAQNANIFSGCNTTEKQPRIRLMFLTKKDEACFQSAPTKTTDEDFGEIPF